MFREIPQGVIDKILGIYKPEFRYLQSAEIEWDDSAHRVRGTVRGNFHVGQSEYARDPRFITALQSELCIHQLCYALLFQGIVDEKFPGIEDMNLYTDSRDGAYLTHFEIDPRRKIESSQFEGEARLTNMRRFDKRRFYFARFDHSLSNGATTGNANFVVNY